MKKQTRTKKFADIADAVKDIRKGRPVKRHGAKDGSIPTHPIVEVPHLSEKEVLKQCIIWLKRHRIFHNRHDCGSGDIAGAGMAVYGIRGAGDVIGLLPGGRHFEIETKAGKGGRLSADQQKRMRNIRANNGIYLVIHGVKELEYYKYRFSIL